MARHIGICLVGGNASADDQALCVGGCFNGGERIAVHKVGATASYAPVPGGPGNCVRCRWFVTAPHYVDALRAHFNNVSYRLAEAARKAKAREVEVEALKLQRLQAEDAGVPFGNLHAYVKAERVWEATMNEVDVLANDLTATFRLIKRCFALLERQREADVASQQMVAVGSLRDVRLAMEETSSELLQLAGVCVDAEIYVDEEPGEAVIRRSQLLDSALYREGLPPVFMTLERKEQLLVGNRFMENLAARAQADDPALGMRRISGVIEAGRRLADLGLDDVSELLRAAMPGAVRRLHEMATPAAPVARLELSR